MEEVLSALETRLLMQYWDTSCTCDMEPLVQSGINPLDISDPGTHAMVWDVRVRNMLRGAPHPVDLHPESMAGWFQTCKDTPLFDSTAPRGHPFPWMFSRANMDLGMSFSHFFEIYVQYLSLTLDGIQMYSTAWFLVNTCEKLWRMIPGNATRPFYIAVFGDASGRHKMSILDADESLRNVRSRLVLKHHEFGLPVETVVLRDGGHSKVVGPGLLEVPTDGQTAAVVDSCI